MKRILSAVVLSLAASCSLSPMPAASEVMASAKNMHGLDIVLHDEKRTCHEGELAIESMMPAPQKPLVGCYYFEEASKLLIVRWTPEKKAEPVVYVLYPAAEFKLNEEWLKGQGFPPAEVKPKKIDWKNAT